MQSIAIIGQGAIASYLAGAAALTAMILLRAIRACDARLVLA